ncbi:MULTISPECIES: serine hydrolase domain-containing protein [Microbulbifer]|uniref:serine hydrolase domain-containing protein n=1 Tax=Microbulbifer TaxID=48073 RepID=UPI001E3768C8|nr:MULTISPECIES: serine hydrolase domain-containing protein [Microbulbifer]UHQ54244.1 beta-lactamase family protein [Microbulbifer sp. YPW16]
MKTLLYCTVVLLIYATGTVAQPEAGPPRNLHELEQAIEAIGARARTPGLAVALVGHGGLLWQHTAGMADLAAGRQVTADTQFRLGSISKMFVSLAVMKLVEEGRVSLSDPLARLAPEIEFHNPWEGKHPVRLVHLLNHSSGWDAPHFPELVSAGGEPISIRAALALHPHSRTSRWVPGSRSAYNNTGPLVAAYIVEKLAGIPYEEFVRRQFFVPLAMNDSGYFYSDNYRSHAATPYRRGRPQGYWHLNNRAAGGLNSSLTDMVKFVRFLLQRGRAGEDRLLSPASLVQMESPRATLAADAGLELAWGLGNTVFRHDDTVFFGHEGSLPGARSLLAYQPELQKGYVILANGEGPAVAEIHRLLSAYIARTSQPAEVQPARALAQADLAMSGLYRSISPVSGRFGFVASLLPWKLQVHDGVITVGPVLGGPVRELVAGSGNTYLQPDSGRVALVRAEDPVAGDVLHYGPQTLVKTGVLVAYAPLLLLVLWLVCTLAGLLMALVWLPRLLLGRGSRGAKVALRAWPMLTVLALGMAIAGVLLAFGGPSPYAEAGRVSVPTLLVFSGTVLFPLMALWSLRVWFRHRDAGIGQVGRFTFWHATAMVMLNLALAAYMFGWGLMGIRLWA